MKININDKLYRFCFWSDARKQIPTESNYYPIVSSRMWQVSNDQDTLGSSNLLPSEQCKADLKLIKQIRPYILMSDTTIAIIQNQLLKSISNQPTIVPSKEPHSIKATMLNNTGFEYIGLAVWFVISIIIFLAQYVVQNNVLHYVSMCNLIILIFCSLNLLIAIPPRK